MIRWKKYNGALIPDEPPHCSPTAEDLAAARKMGGYRFISYTTDFDCPYETPWWYVIKDDPVILENIPSSNTRYSSIDTPVSFASSSCEYPFASRSALILPATSFKL